MIIKLKIKGKEFLVKLANTPIVRRIGCNDREFLQSNEGVLLSFEKPDNYWIWMKNMKFPIDILWIYNNKIVEIKENVMPDNNLIKYFPSKKADGILEIFQGTCKKIGIRLGDIISFVNENSKTKN